MKETYNDKGKLHSFNDKPALIEHDGTMSWFKNGKYHRDNGPAIIYANGTEWWFMNGELHRDNDEPAIIYADGAKWWYNNGKCHRDNDLPAYIDPDGTKEWFIGGLPISEKQVELLKKINASEIKYLPWLLNEDELLNSLIEKRMNEGNI
jgi:hypothetical protein